MPDPHTYWFIAFRPDSDDPLADINEKVGQSGGLSKLPSALHREATGLGQLHLPEFKTAPLSTLVGLSESVAKQDPIATATLLKVLETLRSLTPPDATLDDSLLMDDGRTYDEYLRSGWEWNKAKYRVESRKLEDVVEGLLKDIQAVDNVQKAKVQAYNLSKGQLQQNQRKKTGNLSVRNLSDVVSKDDFAAADSDYLDTLLVAVPKNLLKDWTSSYERLAPLVVPRSSTQLAIDSEFGLYNVTVFKRHKDEFAQKCREKKFTVREFRYDEAEIQKAQKDAEEVEAQEKALGTELLRLSRINFAEAFAALVHLKVIRAYIECLLRYGLPAHFFVAVVKPEPKQTKRLLASLTTYVSSLDNGSNHPKSKKKNGGDRFGGGAANDGEVGGEYAGLLEQEVYEFVLFELVDPLKEGKE